MRHWNPVDIIIGIFAITIAIFLISAVYDVVFENTPLSETGAKRITAIVTSIVSIIALYVGSKLNNREK